MESFSDELSENYEPPKMQLVYTVSRDAKNMTTNKEIR